MLFRSRGDLAGLRMPSLWIGGRRDKLVNPQAMRDAASIAPDSRYVQVDHAGHAPFLTHAGEVAEALLDFLAAGHPHPGPLPPAGEGATAT